MHAELQQLGRLLRTLYNEDDYFIIHIDRRAKSSTLIGVSHLVESLKNVSVISTRTCSWGGVSLVDATLDMMALGLRLHPVWSHAVILSATHLPVQTAEQIRRWAPAGKSILSWDRISGADCPKWLAGTYDRIEWEYVEIPGAGMRKADKLGPVEFSYFKGSQWCTIARPHVEFVVENMHSAIATRLRKSNMADEAFFQTMLLNSPHAASCAQGDSTAAKWVSGASRPAMLSLDELTEMSKTTKKPFIRKVAENLGDEQLAGIFFEALRKEKFHKRMEENCRSAETAGLYRLSS
ncbi:MAG: beta-1,6-N-acetylglucosaminyltransferase [Azospirillaceae bacterium]|nr:beta-1,6-N-acetylglucosaminyltransferase [Azospirillaceae bacterium]